MTGLRPLPWQSSQWQSVSAGLKQRRLAHALLLVGPQGIGKRHFTALLAQALLCRQPEDDQLPCGSCQSCVLFRAGTHPDVFRLEKEEGSKVVKVDDLREFNRKAFLTPQMGQGIVGIIDPVDGMNRHSANALLKSLEEPPAGAHILLVGERWMGLPATLRSRCLLLRFNLPPASAVSEWLRQQKPDAVEWETLRNRYEPDTAIWKARVDSLAALSQGREDPISLAARWQKSEGDLPGLMGWMHGCIADLIKLQSRVPEKRLSNPQSAKALQSIASCLTPGALNGLAGLVLETRWLLEKTQAKPQMLLENLLASWYQVTRTAANKA